MKKILLIAHAPSDNTRALAQAVVCGVEKAKLSQIEITWVPPLQASVDDVLSADVIILGTTENLAYMSGALKDFFDRIYYPCLERTQGLAFCYYIRAGHDGTGTNRAIKNICNGLKWKQIQPEIICRGPWRQEFLLECTNLGENIACGLDFGIY